MGVPYAVASSIAVYLLKFGFNTPHWNSWDFQSLILQWSVAGAMFGLVMGEFTWKTRGKDFQK
jgi:hypothetical protein